MHGAAGDLHAFIQHASMGMQALERGKKGGVNVEMAIPPAAHELLPMQPHEARIAQELDPRLLEGLVEHGIELAPLEVE